MYVNAVHAAVYYVVLYMSTGLYSKSECIANFVFIIYEWMQAFQVLEKVH